MRYALSSSALVLVALLPESVSAMTLVQFLQLFNIFVGLFLVATLIVFVSSVGVYIARFGTWPSYRDTAIRALEWAVVMMFVLVALLGIIQYFERYPRTMVFISAAVVILVLLFTLLRLAAKKPEKKPAPPGRR